MMEISKKDTKELIRRNKPSDYHLLNELFSGKIQEEELSEHMYVKLMRVRACYGHLLSAQSTFLTIGKMIKSFGISQAQAYRDLKLTEKLFGEVRKSNKAMSRQIAENMAKQAYRLAIDQKDPKAAASAAKVYIEATGCNIDDPEMPDFDRIKPSFNVIMISDDLKARIEGNMGNGPVVRKPEDYAEYTEVS